MRNWSLLTVLLILSLLFTSCPGGGDSSGLPGPGSGTDVAVEKQTMLARHNTTRSSLSLPELVTNSSLSTIAQQQAEYMLSISELTHTGAGGSDVGDRASAVGYNWTAIGENIARTSSGASAYELWLASAGHYANITSSDYMEVGIGLATAGSVQYWCVVFGSE